MSDNARRFGINWSLVNAAVGAALVAMAAIPAIDLPLRVLLDLVFWPMDGQPEVLSRDGRLMTVVSGGVLAGWGVLMARVFAAPAGATDLASALLQGLAVWFVLDSAGSIAVGAWPNAVLNTVLLAGFLIPLRTIGAPGKGSRPQPTNGR
ncbi:MAG TPA: hypothetical protein PK970_10875 [Hyphomicrobiaceae bacterium]|nr:hypothetical protein [Hyphomicrobiaceae bacterium]